jgi:hypothetical protein
LTNVLNKEKVKYAVNSNVYIPKIDIYEIYGDIYLAKNYQGVMKYLKLTLDLESNLKISNVANLPSRIKTHIASTEAIFGLYKFRKAHFICLVKSSKSVDSIPCLSGTREVEEMCFVPLKNNKIEKSTVSNSDKKILQLLIETFRRHKFYYSISSYDITRTLQSNYIFQTVFPDVYNSSGSWKLSDDRYFWNYNTIHELVQQKADDIWITPITNAWISTCQLISSDKCSYQLTLVSRRSRFRQGPRYLKRGIDNDGNAANLVETEQIVTTSDDMVSSFVQVI